ncbi:MAG: hypothetical protein Q9183_000532 [Haloplaca sp. 2 TL-2023]
MAYHGRQYQQPPSNGHYRYQDTSHGPPHGRPQEQYMYHEGPPNNEFYDYRDQAPSHGQGGGHSTAPAVESRYDSSQWAQPNQSGPHIMNQQFMDREEDTRNAGYRMRYQQGPPRLPNGAGYQNFDHAHRPYQDPSWDTTPNQRSHQQDSSYIAKERNHRGAPQYDGNSGAPPRADEYRLHGEPMPPPQGHVGAHKNRSALRGKPSGASGPLPQHSEQGMKNSGVAHAGYAPDHRPRTADSRERPSHSKGIRKPEQRTKERILKNSTSPESVSWDNPFPTFPTNKKKAKPAEEESLNRPLGEMSLGHDARGGKPAGSELPTLPRPNDNEWANKEHSHGRNPAHAQEDAPNIPNAWNNNQGLFHNPPSRTAHPRDELRPQTDHGRRSEDTRGNTPFDRAAAYQDSAPRSRTMPNNVSERMADADPRTMPRQQHMMQPTRPDGFDRNPHAPTREEYHQSSRPPMHIHSYSSDGQPMSRFANHEPHRVEPSPHHSQQGSYGDLVDSYYQSPQHSNSYPTQRDGTHFSPPLESPMPNFDESIDTRSGHQRGMTIDDHLQIGQRPRPMPPMPTQGLPDASSSMQARQVIGQGLSHSKSSPNLQESKSQSEQYSDGFNFELPGSVPGMYGPASKSDIGHQHPNVNNNMETLSHRPMQDGGHRPLATYRPQDPRHLPPTNRPGTSGSQGRQRIIPSPEEPHHSQSMRGAPPYEGQPRGVGNGPSPVGRRGPAFPPTEQRRPPVPRKNTSYEDQRRGARNGPSPVAHAGPGSLPGDERQPPPLRNESSYGSQGRSTRSRPSPASQGGPTSPPVASPVNPDALPSHPAPVRPGLMQGAPNPTNHPSRPPPVRQYSSTASSRPDTSSGPKPQISRAPPEQDKSASVSHSELERLRSATRSNPSDKQTQLVLAKKLAEAASVLADEGGRADTKTKTRNQERYMSEAYKLTKKLVQHGFPDAMFYLGDCYTRGSLGLETDAKEAFGQYQSAAKLGHAQAAYRVAVCCEMGLEEGGGTKRDAVKAMQWYNRAATLGDAPAMYKIGVIQLKGLLGQPIDAKAAISWLERAAERADKENPHALHELALLYESPTSIPGLTRDERHAKTLFLQAANLGYKFSQFRLGCVYEYGLLGTTIDPRQSIAWYSKAAVQDEHQSELALSGWYLTGSEGVLQQSDTEAYLWARKAAQAGLAKAEYAMGYFTEVGIGAPANVEDAKRWYWKSASQNFPKARERLEQLRRGGAKMQKTRVSRSKINKQSEGECSVM